MGCCNFNGRQQCDGKESEVTASEQFVRILVFPFIPKLVAYTRYGHTKPEYYVQVGQYRVSLYWDSPQEAWHNASHIMKSQLKVPLEWELEPQNVQS